MATLAVEEEQHSAVSGQRNTLAQAHLLDVDNFPQFEFREGDFWLGRTPQQGYPTGFSDDTHITIVAGNRSGKGTSLIVPNLCTWGGSVVVVDPKGENATVTASRRGQGSDYCEGMGQDVAVLDPFNAVQNIPDDYRAAFNPLDMLDNSPYSDSLVDDAARIAGSLVIESDKGEKFFTDQAKALIEALIMFVVTETDHFPEGTRNLATVRDLITRGAWDDYMHHKENDTLTENITPFTLLFEYMQQSDSPTVCGMGVSMAGMAEKTRTSIFAEASNHTKFLDSPPMQRCLSHSTFTLDQLKTSEKGLSLFLTLPQSRSHSHHRWLRLMTDLTLLEMERTAHFPKNGQQVLMLFDEFAGLEKMHEIEKGVAQIAGFGVKMCFILQSLPQLKSVYKDNWETFLSNSGLKLFFGVEDNFTLDYASKMVGNTQVSLKLQSASFSEAQSVSQSIANSVSHTTGKSKTNNAGTSSGTNKQDGTNRSSNWGESTSGAYGNSTPLSWSSNSGGSSGVNSSVGVTEGVNQSKGYTSTQSKTRSHSETKTEGNTTTHTQGLNESIQKTALLPPEEIRTLHDEQKMLVLIKGKQPLIIKRSPYHADPFFTGLFDPHPNYGDVPLLWKRMILCVPDETDYTGMFEVAPDCTASLKLREGITIKKGELVCMFNPLGSLASKYANADDLIENKLPYYMPAGGVIEEVYIGNNKQLQANDYICALKMNRRKHWLEEQQDGIYQPWYAISARMRGDANRRHQKEKLLFWMPVISAIIALMLYLWIGVPILDFFYRVFLGSFVDTGLGEALTLLVGTVLFGGIPMITAIIASCCLPQNSQAKAIWHDIINHIVKNDFESLVNGKVRLYP